MTLCRCPRSSAAGNLDNHQSMPAPFVCRACARTLRTPATLNAPLLRAPLSRRHYATVRKDGRPFRVAVIGSGPAGFYSAYRLISKIQDAVVDMYEQQLCLSNCQDKFEQVAASPRFNFIGNVAVGTDIPLTDLKPHYDAILFSYGASKDRELGIPGENLTGVYSARAFVGWYKRSTRGNVALDVARILLSDVDTLRKTDIASHALEHLSNSKVNSVKIAAFTIKEVRELFNLPKVHFRPIDSSYFPPPGYKLNRQMARMSKILSEGSPNGPPPPSRDVKQKPNVITSATFHRTAFTPDSDRFDHAARVEPTPELETKTFNIDMVFRSVGYKSEPLPGLDSIGVPFDERRGIIPNDAYGRVTGVGHVPGMYVAGWVKRGPTGVIASTMEDALMTADSIVEDWERGKKFIESDGSGWDAVKGFLESSGVRRVSWEDWKKIDAAERERGAAKGKEREKFVTKREILSVLDGSFMPQMGWRGVVR
ncbi:putative NADPH-adrenodoxin reductase arh1 protein [Botryosphaeria dothidea]|uniref:NADPH:adrenodoxin oxidoreductase, mitochondrial n=1 Tax=Botryosphaeria dothidea TaxID=55169 RepID=A0A8H4IMQ6_9PEZI|nr:putative NADPH-adrenodoxin reductase arh1 protein [Botryosphaeria dothidea]